MSASRDDSVNTADLQARLESAERQMELLLNSVPDGVVTIDESQTIQSFNLVAEGIFGYEASEVIGKPLEMLIPESFRGSHRQHVEGFAKDEEGVRRMGGRLELSGRRKDGTTFPAEAAILHTQQPDGRNTMTAIIRDVSERRSADELYRTLVTQSNDGIVILQDDMISFANPAALELIGYPAGETINWLSLIPSEDREALVANNRARIEGKDAPDQYPVTLIRKDGERIVAEIKPKAIEYQGQPAVLIFLRDLAQRNEMERAVRERGERLAMLFNESTDAILVVQPGPVSGQARMIDVNDRVIEMFGYSADELGSMIYPQLMAPGELDRSPIPDAILDAGGIANIKREMIRKDGTLLSVEVRARRLSDGTRMIVLRDITVQAAAETIIRERGERLAMLFNESADGVLVTLPGDHSAAARIIESNARALEILGYSSEELSHLAYQDLLAPGELEREPIHVEQLNAGLVTHVERRMVRRDGEIIIVDARSRRLSDGNSIVSLHDITLQRQIEQAVEASNARLSMLFHESLDAVLVADDNLTIIDSNQAALDLLGQSEDDLRGSSILDLYSRESVERDPLEIERVSRGELVENEREIVRPDGTVVPVDVRVRRLSDATRMLVLRDISERVEREQALRDSEAELRRAQELAGMGTFVVDVARDEATLSEEVVKLLGLRNDVVSRSEWFGLVHPDDAGELLATVGRALETGSPYQSEYRVITPDGETVTVHAWATVDEGSDPSRTFIRGVMQDVTAQRALEQELREREAELQQAQRLARMGTWSSDVALGELQLSDELVEMLGLPSNTLGPGQWEGRIHPDDIERVRASRSDGLESGAPYELEYSVAKQDGEFLTIHSWAAAEEGPDGAAAFVRGVMQDVTELRSAEQALREREAELRQSHRLSRMGTWTLDVEQDQMTFSDELVALLDLPGNQMTRLEWVAIVHPEDIDQRHARFRQGLKDKRAYETDYRVIKPNGAVVTAHAWNTVEVGPDGNATFFHGVVQDVTAQRELEQTLRERDQQLLQGQRLESLGLLAGGIAHDFNNILAAVMGNAGYLQMTMQEDEAALEVVKEIENAAAKGAELIAQLVAFSRNQELRPRVIELAVAVTEFLRMTRPIMGAGVEIATEVAEDLWTVTIDPTQFDQVLMNLVVNARDAMPDGGTITIGLRNQKLSAVEAERIATIPGEYVLLSVTDSGQGMEPDVVAHVFDPFYSTKAPHEGTGLGLSTVHGIVTQSGGHISVVSDPGVGTAFTVLLPRSSEEDDE